MNIKGNDVCLSLSPYLSVCLSVLERRDAKHKENLREEEQRIVTSSITARKKTNQMF